MPSQTRRFQIETPILLSEWEIPTGYLEIQENEREQYYLLLEYVSAVYDQERRFYGGGWSGQVRFRVASRFSSGSLNDVITEGLFPELCFEGPFLWQGGDFNGDGHPDLVLTQWGSSSGGDYGTMITLNPDGTVELLPVNGDRRKIGAFGFISLAETETGTFLIPYRHTGGSMELEEVDGGFTVETSLTSSRGDWDALLFLVDDIPEDISVLTLRDIYQWRDDHFELVRQELCSQNAAL